MQILLSFFAGSQIASGIHILTPAAIFFMNTGVLPKIFLSDNSMLALNLLASSDSLSVLRKASDGGIDGAVKDAAPRTEGHKRALRRVCAGLFSYST